MQFKELLKLESSNGSIAFRVLKHPEWVYILIGNPTHLNKRTYITVIDNYFHPCDFSGINDTEEVEVIDCLGLVMGFKQDINITEDEIIREHKRRKANSKESG